MSRPPATNPVNRGESIGAARRARYAMTTVVLLVATTAAAVLAVMLSARANVRWDATSDSEHTLSPRTVGILHSVKEPTNIVLCADLAGAEPRARQRTDDLLEEFSRVSPLVHVERIDTASPGAVEKVNAVVGALAKRDQEAVVQAGRVLEHVEAVNGQLSQTLAPLAEGVSQSAKSITDEKGREAMGQAAAALRVSVKDLAASVERIRDARTKGPTAGPGAGAATLPEADKAQLAGVNVLVEAAKACAQSVALLDGTPDAAAHRDSARALDSARDQAAAAAEALRSIKPLEPLLISRLLHDQQAVVVYSSQGTAAINFEALFPPSSKVEAQGESLFAGEELLGSAVASLNVASRPVVILVHAERDRLLDGHGEPTPYAQPSLGKMLERLHLRKIDLGEWAVALDAARPVLAGVDPSGTRPKVWFVLPAPARINLDPKRGLSMAERAQRIGKLADAVKTLIDGHDSFIISLEPSELPAVGEADPIAQALEPLGIKADTAHPLIERLSTAHGPAISAYQTLRGSDSPQPIAQAVNGIPTVLQWPSPLALASPPPTGWTVAPVLTVPKSADVWGESSWLAMRYANLRQPLQPLAPPASSMPTPDPASDNLNGPWTVAAAAERSGATGQGPQRVLVVGAPSWFEDVYTQAASTVDARRFSMFPGNSELFESGMYWAASQDELIAPSPRIRDVPRITPMTEGTLALVRWTLIAGLPLLVLCAGIAARILPR